MNNQERIFGTDGIRGTPGIYPLSDGMVFKIGSSLAKLIFHRNKQGASHTVIIGRDTRTSGRRLEVILSNALSFCGIDVLLAGTIPTPGLSYLVRHTKSSMGIMISASHNQASDNGIKFFTEDGFKLSAEEEIWMEQLILGSLIHISNGGPHRGKGKIESYAQAAEVYIDFLASTVADTDLRGFKVILDCAWGANSNIAPDIFRKLGIDTYSIHDIPEGKNINKGGTMNPEMLRQQVLAKSADIGFAFDGDGDRVILVDRQGRILDGDYIIAIIGLHLLAKGRLASNTVVTTVMSNHGLKRAIESHLGSVVTTKVGDKHVVEALRVNNLNFGGEQSGHIIISDYAPTPDGLLVALQILKIMKESGKSLSDLSAAMYKLPQALINVKVRCKKPLQAMPAVSKAISDSNEKLGGSGRLLVRYSGTENLARIMVEGEDSCLIQEIASSLRDIFERELGVEELEPYAKN